MYKLIAQSGSPERAIAVLSAATYPTPLHHSFTMFPLLLRAARASTPRHLRLTARSFATGKDVRFSTEARNLMARGVNSLADAVEVTLGPKGRNVVIEKSFGAPQITKDGVTVAKNIEFKDKHMNLGAQLVRSVANDTNNIAGDGTTTATVLTRAIYTEGIKAVAAGMNPMDLKRGIDLAVEKVLKSLKTMTQPITTKEEINSVSYTVPLYIPPCCSQDMTITLVPSEGQL